MRRSDFRASRYSGTRNDNLAAWASAGYTGSNGAIYLFLLCSLFVALILLRFLITSSVLAEVIAYNLDGGSPLEKIHFTTYGLLLLLVLALTSLRIDLTAWELKALKAFALLAIVCGVYFAIGLLFDRSVSAGFLIDSYIAACIMGALMLIFPPAWREAIGSVLLVFTVISAAIAIVEFMTKQRFLPYPFLELTFRPTGLTSHPLQLGLYSATAIAFVPLTRWAAWFKVTCLATLLLGSFVAGARIAAIAALMTTLVIVLMLLRSRLRSITDGRVALIFVFGAILIVAPATYALYSLGLTGRFNQELFDKSAMARVEIYQLFSLVSWSDILFGADIRAIRNLALERLDLEFIESSIIILVFQFGLIGALLFVVTVARTVTTLVRGGGINLRIGTAAFVFVALTNNAFTAKEPALALLVLLVLAFRNR